jgi:hypothetical protein
MHLTINSSVLVRIIRIFTNYYSVVLTNEVIAREDEISPSNADGGMARPKTGSLRTAQAAMHPAAERIAACDFRKASAWIGRH